jgi:hypothetical protein
MSRLSRWTGRLGVVALTGSACLIGSVGPLTSASADSPMKVGWWNAASGGGQGAPAPDATAGGIRVAVSGSQVLSFGAVQYNLPADGGGTLELSVTGQSPQPSSAPANPAALPDTNEIVACPTKDNSWKAGDDQDASTAPAYDCSLHHFVGALSSDGKTMTFLLDGAADLTPGILSLAILPDTTTSIYELGTDAPTDATPPYYIDYDKPSATSLTVTSGTTTTAPAPPPPPSASSTATTPSGSGVGAPPSTTGGSGASISVPPATTTDPGQTPVVANQQATTGAVQPAAAAKPTTDNTKRNLAWGLLIALVLAVLASNAAQQQRYPRVLAGPGATPTDTGGQPVPTTPEAAAAAMPWLAMFAPRGLGRFAKPRTVPARPLT